MSTTTKARLRRAAITGLTLAALATAGATTATAAATAAATAGTGGAAHVDASRATAAGPGGNEWLADVSWAASGTGEVRPAASCFGCHYGTVPNALVRSWPSTGGTRVSQAGRTVDLLCGVDGSVGDGGMNWFTAHPSGSTVTGWMRTDQLHRGTNPHPGHC